MKRQIGTFRRMFATIAVLALALGALPVAAAQPAAIVSGAGTAHLTYTGTDLPDGPYPAAFRFVGVLGDDGSAEGHVNVIFTGAGAAAWGAVSGVRKMHLAGNISTGMVEADGTVVLEGRLTETDHVERGGIGWTSDEPFTIRVGGDMEPDAFTLQWCLLAPFAAKVTDGNLRVHTPGETAVAATIRTESRRSCGPR